MPRGAGTQLLVSVRQLAAARERPSAGVFWATVTAFALCSMPVAVDRSLSEIHLSHSGMPPMHTCSSTYAHALHIRMLPVLTWICRRAAGAGHNGG